MASVGTVRVGIDLGTTFSCVAYVGDGSRPRDPSADGTSTTPSVLCFDGREAQVGSKAYEACAGRSSGLFQFVKRDTGKPPVAEDQQEAAPYLVDGFRWGVVGMQGVLLRKLKLDAIAYFRREGRLPPEADETNVEVEAVITVPAYFGDVERMQTRQAGHCAGLSVLGVVNEPTAAALAYGLAGSGMRRLLVFDLGGGTFDVTLVELGADGHARVLASDGNRELGGKDLDDLILDYLKTHYFRQNERPLADEHLPVLRRIATRVKHELSARDQAEARLDPAHGVPGVLDATLHRTPPPDHNPYEFSNTFYLEERATNLFTQIRSLCESALRQAEITLSESHTRPMTWGDLHEIILVGGSSRMPIIERLVEDLTGLQARPHPEGFDYDTAVAVGAALYAEHPETVEDVVARGVGIKLGRREDGRVVEYVKVLIPKNSPLPAHFERTFKAQRNAKLDIYQGETERPYPSNHRGRLELDNPSGEVTVGLDLDAEGRLTATASFAPTPGAPHQTHALEIRNALFDAHLNEVSDRVSGVRLNP